MLKKLLDLFVQPTQPSVKNDELIKLAAISLLVEVTKADHCISFEEEANLVSLVNTHFDFEHKDEAEAIITSAKSRVQEATSLYEFTQLINEHYSAEQKMQLIIMMWKIAFSDGDIDRYEEHLIRRVADLIYLPHVKFIEAKHIAQTTL